MKHDSQKLKQFIKTLGFENIGIVKAKKLDAEARQLEQWLKQSLHGEMSYMERYFDFRIDPTKLLPGTKSILVLSLNYFQQTIQHDGDHPKISIYAYGEDYHKVIRNKTKQILNWMQQEFGAIQARAFVDSGPVLERVWAKESGISWSGKNTLAIHPRCGSYFFLTCILTDIEFEYDTPIKDYCGTCRKCIDACPTQAIHQDGYLLDASKCISYLTIELKNEIPEQFKGKMEDWIFGCDICQDVCPWNRFSAKTKVAEFSDSRNSTHHSFQEWMEMTEDEFSQLYKNSPIKRTKLGGIKRNIQFIKTS